MISTNQNQQILITLLTSDVKNFRCVKTVDDASLDGVLERVNSHAIPVIIKVLQHVNSRVLVHDVKLDAGLEYGRDLR